MTAEEQTEKLANYIMANFPNFIVDGGAGDVAIQIMKRQKMIIQALGKDLDLPETDFLAPETFFMVVDDKGDENAR